jgi:hypothetical protein
MPEFQPPHSKFRAYAFSAGLLVFGLVVALEGWRSWSEGSVMVYLKGRTAFVASPSSDTELWFYCFTLGWVAVGILSWVAATRLMWLVSFAPPSQKDRVITELSYPLGTRFSPKIPTWFFWAVIALMVATFIYAAIKHT